MYRTNHCQELRKDHVGQIVKLAGWVHRRRDHGGCIFIDLRDRHGLTQIVFDPKIAQDAWSKAENVRSEYVLQITGKVRPRLDGATNPNLKTGEIEVEVAEVEILNKAKTPPFVIDQEEAVGEEMRLKYRYLDMRRERLKRNLIMRHKIVKHIRDFLDRQDFVEIETPILIKGTPEGAREYVVPSRLYHGKFYVLPQSPQQLKQLLMVAGMDRYFQIARCFRDEDQRGDRQPEFTQLDMELSFVTQEEIIELNSALALSLCQELYPHKKIKQEPFLRLTWEEAMNKYGSDKPDLRFGLEMTDLTEELKTTEFKVFAGAIANGGVVKALKVEGGAKFSRKDIDDLEEVAKIYGARGLAYILYSPEEGPKSPLLKFLSAADQKIIQEKTEAQPGDVVFFGAGDFLTVCESLGAVRNELGKKLNLTDPNELAFAWVYDFPMFGVDKGTGKLEAMHHPFTRPLDKHRELLKTDPAKALSAAYDFVLNGSEIGGGSLRIHEKELQSTIFEILKIAPEEAQRRFGHMLEAFEFGAPPHGGIAWGLDRFVMIMQDEPNIREVIPFPKDQKAKDLMLGAPDLVKEEDLDALGIKVETEEE